MEKIKSLFEDLEKALNNLETALVEPPTEMNQDATIQRFEFTFELSWKLMQVILKENGIDSYGIKTTIREAARFGIVEDPLSWFDFLEERNLTTHTYDQKEARKVYTKVKGFPKLVEKLLNLSKSHIE